MLNQDPRTDPDQDNATDQIEFQVDPAPNPVAEKDPEGGESEGHQPDDHRLDDDRGLDDGQRDAHGQRVDACRHPKTAKRPPAEDIEAAFLLLLARTVVNHLAPKIEQERESHPMVERLNVTLEPLTREKADQRHSRLKERHHARHLKDLIESATLLGKSATRHRDRQAIHRQPNGEQNHLNVQHPVRKFRS